MTVQTQGGGCGCVPVAVGHGGTGTVPVPEGGGGGLSVPVGGGGGGGLSVPEGSGYGVFGSWQQRAEHKPVKSYESDTKTAFEPSHTARATSLARPEGSPQSVPSSTTKQAS